MKLSIIIPVFNSSETLDLLNHEIFKVVSKIDLKNDFELIFINDNSEDDSWKKIKKLKEDFSYIKAINFSENFGQHNAIFAGFSFCSGEKVITLDELQEEITTILEGGQLGRVVIKHGDDQ